MEEFAILNCFLTLILVAALFFFIKRLGNVRRELSQRIERLEVQLAAQLEATPSAVVAPSAATVPAEQEQAEAGEANLLGTDLQEHALSAPGVERGVVAALPAPSVAAHGAASAPLDQAPDGQELPPKPTPHTGNLPPLLHWFLRTHLMVQVGIVILFIGVAFLLKYVADQGWLSLEMRHVLVAIGGAAMAGIGWRLRQRTRNYGLALQGAGIGVVYMTVFFAFRIYSLLPAGMAFGALAVLGALCAGLAVLNNARLLAFLAMIGAFLAPILASTGQGSHVAFFSYYALVNLAILAIAWFKTWRSLNLAGFFFTLTAGTVWGVSSYRPELFSSTEPFLLLFFLFYLAIAILYAVRQPATESRGANLIDTTLLFGNPLCAFSLQVAAIRHIENGAGWSALALGALYVAIALFFIRRRAAQYALLSEALLFLGFFFAALSAPFLLDAQNVAATWAVSGGAWVWLGTQRQRIWNVLWGGLVQAGAMLSLVLAVVDGIESAPPWLNALYLGILLISGAAFVSAFYAGRLAQSLDKSARGLMRLFSLSFLLLALLWWLGGHTWQIIDASMATAGAWRLFLQKGWLVNLMMFYSATALAGEVIGHRLHWRALRISMLGLLPLLVVLAVGQLALTEHHFVLGGWYAWPLALGVCYFLLYRWRQMESVHAGWGWRDFGHAGALCLTAFLLVWFSGWQVDQVDPGSTWVVSSVTAICALFGLLAMQLAQRGPAWIRGQQHGYLRLAAPIIFLAALTWSLLVHMDADGAHSLLLYLPLLNPLDISYLLLFGILFAWIRQLRLSSAKLLYWTWGVLGFFAFNLLLARAVHHLTGVPFEPQALYDSPIMQVTLAILWSVLALALMFWGARRTSTSLWSGGAAVLALTVLKLFLVDLAHSGAIERIVSFIGVGLLITLIAYLAPAPIKRAQIDEAYNG